MEKRFILILLEKFITSIANKEKVLTHLSHFRDANHGWAMDKRDMYNDHKTILEEMYYLKSLLENRLQELNKEKGAF